MTEEVHRDPEDEVEDRPEVDESEAVETDETPATLPEESTEEPEQGLSVEDIAVLKTDEIRDAFARAMERDQYVDRLKRLQAEFDNYRRREARDRANWRRNSIRVLVLDILQVVDNFERALGADPGPEGHAGFVTGIELVEKQLAGVLEQAGLRPIEARGKPFDPALHEAVATAPADDAEAGIVLEELQRGYTMDDVVLRPTRVCVVQNPAPAERGEEEPAERDASPDRDAGDEDD